jgi:hypothetical protein
LDILILLLEWWTFSREICDPQLLLENLSIFIGFWTGPLRVKEESEHI